MGQSFDGSRLQFFMAFEENSAQGPVIMVWNDHVSLADKGSVEPIVVLFVR